MCDVFDCLIGQGSSKHQVERTLTLKLSLEKIFLAIVSQMIKIPWYSKALITPLSNQLVACVQSLSWLPHSHSRYMLKPMLPSLMWRSVEWSPVASTKWSTKNCNTSAMKFNRPIKLASLVMIWTQDLGALKPWKPRMEVEHHWLCFMCIACL